MKHFASRRFWRQYERLPHNIRRLADQNFELLKKDYSHPSSHFRRLGGGRFFSVRVGLHYRALEASVPEGVQWFWIGTHSEYDQLIG